MEIKFDYVHVHINYKCEKLPSIPSFISCLSLGRIVPYPHGWNLEDSLLLLFGPLICIFTGPTVFPIISGACRAKSP